MKIFVALFFFIFSTLSHADCEVSTKLESLGKSVGNSSLLLDGKAASEKMTVEPGTHFLAVKKNHLERKVFYLFSVHGERASPVRELKREETLPIICENSPLEITFIIAPPGSHLASITIKD